MAMLSAIWLGAHFLVTSWATGVSLNRPSWTLSPRAWPANQPKPLVFKDGRFKIAVFSDLHFGERNGDGSWAAWGVDQDINSTRVMNNVLDDEAPSLVVFNGDQVTGENLYAENATSYLDQVFAPAVRHDVPFASIYGNHDASVNISHAKLYAYEKGNFAQYSYTQSTPSSASDQAGIYNYYVPVYGDETFDVPRLILWFFDSRSGIFNDPLKYEDWVDPKVAQWINSTVAMLLQTYGFLPPSLSFVHIPPNATLQVQSTIVAPDPSFPGINIDSPADPQGQHHPNVLAPDLPFWTALTGSLGGKDGTGLIATVMGHDHGDNWCAKSQEVPHTLCFARHTGYGGYGNWERGSRVFEFELGTTVRRGRRASSLSVESWMRMEDHSTANRTKLM